MTEAGAYRAEINVVPYHLKDWLGDNPDHFMKVYPFILCKCDLCEIGMGHDLTHVEGWVQRAKVITAHTKTARGRLHLVISG